MQLLTWLVLSFPFCYLLLLCSSVSAFFWINHAYFSILFFSLALTFQLYLFVLCLFFPGFLQRLQHVSLNVHVLGCYFMNAVRQMTVELHVLLSHPLYSSCLIANFFICNKHNNPIVIFVLKANSLFRMSCSISYDMGLLQANSLKLLSENVFNSPSFF